jgi:peptide/nickel transport system permease protein
VDVKGYIVKRTLLSVAVIIGTITITFLMSHLIPGNPAVLFAGQNPTPDQIARITAQYGFDKPLYVQFYLYLTGLLTGDLGLSYVMYTPVGKLLAVALPNTFTLAGLAAIIATLIGLPIGILSARYHGRRLDSLLRVFSVSFVALPVFWFGLLIQQSLALHLQLLPIASYGGTLLFFNLHPIRSVTGSFLIDSLIDGDIPAFLAIGRSMILPLLTLSLYPIGVVFRQTRSAMLSVLNQDYIRTARAYGLSEREINYRFALRNALPPLLVTLGLIFAGSIISVVFVEDIFVLTPGVGYLIRTSVAGGQSTTALSSPDYNVILGITIVISIIYVITNFVVDLLQIHFDKRIAFKLS